MESVQWLEPFRPFSTVRKLYTSKELGLRVARYRSLLKIGDGCATCFPELS